MLFILYLPINIFWALSGLSIVLRSNCIWICWESNRIFSWPNKTWSNTELAWTTAIQLSFGYQLKVDRGICRFDSLLYCDWGISLECILRGKVLWEWTGEQRRMRVFSPCIRSVTYQCTTRGQCGAIFLHMLRAITV